VAESTIQPDDIDRVLGVIRRIPDGYRRFDQSVDESAIAGRLSPELLDRLLSAGLPYRVESGVTRLDRFDIENVTMLLDLPSLKGTTSRLWSSALAELPDVPVVRYGLTIAARCPRPGHDGPCEFRLADWLTTAPGVTEVRSTVPGRFEAVVSLPADKQLFTGSCGAVLSDVQALRYCVLPPQLGRDLDFVARTGLADCRLITHYLLASARRREVPARKASGLFLARPLATRHNWIELCDETSGRWLPADPFILRLLADLRAVDPELLPPGRALNGVLLAVDREAFFADKIIVHGPDKLRPAVRVARLDAGSPSGNA
jgi:hypothetical protein